MRRLIVLEFMTLDGVIQGPGGRNEDPSGGFEYSGWSVPYSDEAVGEAMEQQMQPPFELLLGRKTYDIWAPYWPQHEAVWPGINSVRKYVASSNENLTLEWENSHLLKGDVAAQVRRLKGEAGPDLHCYGSANLVQTLFQHDLVDELWLKVYPLTLGQGKRLFADGTMPGAWKVRSSMLSPNGIYIANFARAGEVLTGSYQ